MKAITVDEPWAWLIALGEKIHETRSWKPYGMLKRGDLLAIHASKKWTREEQQYCIREPFRSVLLKHDIRFPDAQLPRGKVLCICKFVDIHHTEEIVRNLTAQERAFGNFGRKRFAWQLEVIHRFPEPIPAVGQQRVWDWEPPATNGDSEEEVQTVDEPKKIEQLRLL